MFELLSPAVTEPVGASPAVAAAVAPYGGPERRAASSTVWCWFAAALDEIDYGMLLLNEEGQALHVNRAAHAELDSQHPLQLTGGELRAGLPRDAKALGAALEAAARRGLRKLLTLGNGAQQVSVSVVPIGVPGHHALAVTLVILGKRQVGADLAVQGFARSHGLTPCETRVLVSLCNGACPADIAAEHGVALSTVRSQIGSIRLKTAAPSIRALVRQVAVLPPLMGVLRQVAAREVTHSAMMQ